MSIFSKIKVPKIKSSVFNLSQERKIDCNFGELIPILCQEVLPHDKFKVSTELLIKLVPLKSPMMHRVQATVHYFFVPTFQINSVFEKFINPKVNTDNSIVLPYLTPAYLNNYGKVSGRTDLLYSLCDYLGLPILNSGWLSLDNTSTLKSKYVNIDPFRAYQHIYNSFYRDENCERLEDAVGTTTSLFLVGNFLSSTGYFQQITNQVKNLLKLRTRAWAKDYFTSALPSPQAGDDVLIPMTGLVQPDGQLKFGTTSEYAIPSEQSPVFDGTSVGGTGAMTVVDAEDTDVSLTYGSGLKVVNASSSINDLRRAMALQKFKELAERGGTRYSEMVRNFFGAFLKDYWIDRPIYLGGQVQNVNVGEVVQTSATDTVTVSGASATSYLGERGGIAHSYGRTKTVSLNAPCHGYLFGILSLRPQATYQQGLERMWTRSSIFDWAFPQFARMGEQEIWNYEIFAQGTSDDDGVFGYTPRYAEYKTGHTEICGSFRNSLGYWHLGRIFDSLPTLSKSFVMMDSPSYAAFNVTSSSTRHVIVDLYNKIVARRALPYFGTPSSI